MSARGLYEAVLIELNKTNAPNIMLDDFNYFINKAIQQYINKRYNIYDISQQTTDDIRVLKATAILDVVKTPYNEKINDSVNWNDFMFMGATYTAELPQDYYHLLNCMCFYKVNNTYSCWDKGKIARAKATRLTADAWSQVVDNYWNRPTFKNPYYYIHNVNTSKDVPTNPVNQNIGDIENTGTDKLYEERVSLNLSNGVLNVNLEDLKLAEATTPQEILATTSEELTTAYVDGNPERLDASNRNVANLVIPTTTSSSQSSQASSSQAQAGTTRAGSVTTMAAATMATPATSTSMTMSTDVKNLVGVATTTTELPKTAKVGDYGISTDRGLVKKTVTNYGTESWTKEEPKKNDLFKFKNRYYLVNGQLKLSEVRANTSKTDANYLNGEQIEDPFRTIDINGFIKDSDGNKYPQRSSQVRYGNASKVLLEIRYGEDTSTFELFKVMVDYIKAPQHIRLTQEQIDRTLDYSQILEFPDYVCQEIVNELVTIIMENISDQRLQTHPVVSQSIANPAQQQTPDAATTAK